MARAKKSGKKWIQAAVSKNPGALRAQAKAAGKLRKDGTIDPAWLAAQAKKGNTKIAKRARLAQTLKKMRKK